MHSLEPGETPSISEYQAPNYAQRPYISQNISKRFGAVAVRLQLFFQFTYVQYCKLVPLLHFSYRDIHSKIAGFHKAWARGSLQCQQSPAPLLRQPFSLYQEKKHLSDSIQHISGITDACSGSILIWSGCDAHFLT